MVFYVLSLNNFIITKPIKTIQNVKHIIRKPEYLGGMLVYRLTNSRYLLLYMRSSILHTCGKIIIEHDIYEHSYCYYSFVFIYMYLVYLGCTSKCSATEPHGWVLGFEREFGE